MSKSIQIQAGNKLNLAGKLMDVAFGDGKLSDGRPYQQDSRKITEVSCIYVWFSHSGFTNVKFDIQYLLTY